MQRYLGKVAKEKMREQVKEAAARGSLEMLARLVNDPRRIERNQQEFMAARMKATVVVTGSDHLPSLTAPGVVVDIVLKASAVTD